MGLAASLASVAILIRDFLRQVLLLNSRPGSLLRSDGAYVVLLLITAVIAAYVFAPEAAPFAVLGLGIAALVAVLFSYRIIQREIGWRRGGGAAAFLETCLLYTSPSPRD